MEVTPTVRLFICVVGIYFFYLYYGILQEELYHPDPIDGSRFDATFFLLFIQCLVNFIMAYALLLVFGPEKSSKPLSSMALTSPLYFSHSGFVWVALISLSYLLAMGSSNQALLYVSYAFQALAKSCKMIPVMLGNVLLGGKRYKLKEYLIVIMITSGVALFELSRKKGNFGGTSYGLILLALSLLLDGFTGSNQKLFADEYKPSSQALMLHMNLWSLIFLLPILFVTGQGISGLQYFLSKPAFQYKAMMFALCSAMGQNFIFYTITGPGPLACATITTTRKFFTILVSVFLYPENRLNNQQWGAVLLVFFGLFLELHDKYNKTKSTKHVKEA